MSFGHPCYTISRIMAISPHRSKYRGEKPTDVNIIFLRINIPPEAFKDKITSLLN
jgi:hypothetical protein